MFGLSAIHMMNARHKYQNAPRRLVTRAELKRALIKEGMTAERAEFHAKTAVGLGGGIGVGDEVLEVKKAKMSPFRLGKKGRVK